MVTPSDVTAPPISGVDECWMELDGARVRYLRAGSGPALVLVHGLLGYSFSWRYTMPALAPYATVYAPDLPGAGFSDRPAELDCGLRETARRLVRLIGELGISSFDLVGTSHGGAVAMMAATECLGAAEHARMRPGVRRLALVAPVNPYSVHGRRLARLVGSLLGAALFRLTIARMTFLYRYELIRLYGNSKRIPPGTLEGYMAPLAIPGRFEHGLKVAGSWTADLRELEAALPKLADVPTLLLWGGMDRAVDPSSAARLAEHFRSCRTVVFPGVGHLPYEECPEDFNRALIQFLTRDEAKENRPVGDTI